MDEIQADTTKVQETAGGRNCKICHQYLQWVNGKWKCLEHDSTQPQDWKHPMSGGLTVKGGLEENDKVEIIKQDVVSTTTESVRTFASLPVKEDHNYVIIPFQAMELFKSLTLETLSVKLTSREAQILLDKLNEMEPPKSMKDAKAIIRLSDELEKIINA